MSPRKKISVQDLNISQTALRHGTDRVVLVDLLLPPEDAQAAQSQRLHLVLPGDDHHPAQVVQVVDDLTGEQLGVCQPAGENQIGRAHV